MKISVNIVNFHIIFSRPVSIHSLYTVSLNYLSTVLLASSSPSKMEHPPLSDKSFLERVKEKIEEAKNRCNRYLSNIRDKRSKEEPFNKEVQRKEDEAFIKRLGEDWKLPRLAA